MSGSCRLQKLSIKFFKALQKDNCSLDRLVCLIFGCHLPGLHSPMPSQKCCDFLVVGVSGSLNYFHHRFVQPELFPPPFCPAFPSLTPVHWSPSPDVLPQGLLKPYHKKFEPKDKFEEVCKLSKVEED